MRPTIEITAPEIIEAERDVIGASLRSEDCLDVMLSMLEIEDFYTENNRDIFGAMKSLRVSSKPVDVVTVPDYLKVKGRPELRDVVFSMAEYGDFTSGTVETYCKMIIDKSTARKLITAAHDIERESGESDDTQALVEFAERKIYDITERKSKGGFNDGAHMVTSAMEQIEKAKKQDGIIGFPTYFKEIDEIIGGFEKKLFTIIAGRPGMGKTAFAACLANRMCIDNKIPLGIFSIEMPEATFGQRMLSLRCRKNLYAVRHGFISMNDESFIAAQTDIASSSILIDERAHISLDDIRSKIRATKKKKGAELYFIDHLGKLKAESKNPFESMSIIADKCQTIAKELDVALIGFSHLSRLDKNTYKNGKSPPKPTLHDLKMSGNLEGCSQLVIFLHRDFYYTKKEEDKGRSEIIIEKHTNGPTGTVLLKWVSEQAEFTERDETDDIGF
jgi:replicative DNA helicase